MSNTTKANRVNAIWLTYATTVLPPNAPDIQRQECKLAFFAGAAGIMSLQMREISLLPDDVACEAMDEAFQECADLADQYLKTGKVP